MSTSTTSPKPHLAAVPIFRKAALDHHVGGKNEGALPDFLSHRLMGVLWLIALGTVAVMALIWRQPAPHLVIGNGRVVDARGALVVAIEEGADHVRPGQALTCSFVGGPRLAGRVEQVAGLVHARLAGAGVQAGGTCQAVIRAGTRPLVHFLGAAELFDGDTP